MAAVTRRRGRVISGVAVVGALVVALTAVGRPALAQRSHTTISAAAPRASATPCGGTRALLSSPDLGIKADPAQALPVDSLSYGVSNPQMATAGTMGKPQVSPVSVQLHWVAQEPRLFTLLTTGRRLKELRFLFVGSSGNATIVCRSITLTDVAVSSLQESFASGGGGGALSVAFDYTKIALTTGNGQPGGATTAGYDLTTNKVMPPGTPTP